MRFIPIRNLSKNNVKQCRSLFLYIFSRKSLLELKILDYSAKESRTKVLQKRRAYQLNRERDPIRNSASVVGELNGDSALKRTSSSPFSRNFGYGNLVSTCTERRQSREFEKTRTDVFYRLKPITFYDEVTKELR